MATRDTTYKCLKFEEGWPVIQEGIKKVVELIEGVRSDQFTSEEYMRFYTVVYEICQPHPAGPECEKLYQGYKKTFEDYITAKVLPFLREKKDENLLQELVTKWNMHKVMTRWLVRFFHYLNRYFISIRKLPTLNATSLLTFYKLVYIEMNDQVREVVISMIEREREGEQIDQALVKNVLDIYVEIGEGSMTYYAKDFEEAMLKDTTSFYSKKATIWNASLSYKDYMLKVEECITKEEDRVSCYLQSRSRQKLLAVLVASKTSSRNFRMRLFSHSLSLDSLSHMRVKPLHIISYHLIKAPVFSSNAFVLFRCDWNHTNLKNLPSGIQYGT